MIQRIQSVYLALVFIIVAVLPYVFPLWTLSDGKSQFFMSVSIYPLFFGFSTMLSVVSLLYFKKRQHQFVLNRLNLLSNLILLVLFVYRSLNVSGETLKVSEKGIGMFLPIFAIVFLVLANKAIKKDEDLVKSVDRLR